jgi:hypothetical protein
VTDSAAVGLGADLLKLLRVLFEPADPDPERRVRVLLLVADGRGTPSETAYRL